MRKYIMICIGLLKLFNKMIINLGRLKTNGIKYFIGKNVKFWIHSGGNCDIGIKTWFSDFCSFEANGGNIRLGYNNFFNTNCRVIAMNDISIGDNNLFGPNVVIVDHKHEYSNPNDLICKQGMSSASVKIGSDIWVCANVVITKGVTIGNRIVVAANSVVSNDLLEPGVYAGSPAKMVKKL
ncbi:acyltransferase [Neobacillus niacini]|uniref:acyltransferase n=1 Tax=Neobacillus niacini TaxID=86668 RepID=UPI001C8DA9F4|nr:acyltransferase [Neobacillus niacini]MBY0145121.1 acyltransferase [Neobacillus niacini]